MHSVIDQFLYALVALLVIVDPLGTAALFAALTPRDSAAERDRQARRACLIAFVVMAAFGVAGEGLLRGLGITLPALKVAGGILMFLTAIEMVIGQHKTRQSDPEREAAIRQDDISVFPLAIPLIAGPGSMTTMVVMNSQAAGSPWRLGMTLLALAVTIGLTFIALLAARSVSRLLGETGASVVGRVLGVLLAALAAQIALDGIKQSLLGG